MIEEEPPPPDPELEAAIRTLVEIKNAAKEDGPEYLFCIRCLAGLRYSREDAGGLIEDIDPYWGSDARPLPETATPEGHLLPFRARSKDKAS